MFPGKTGHGRGPQPASTAQRTAPAYGAATGSPARARRRAPG